MNIQQILLSVLGTALTALAAWGVERLTAWLSTKIKNGKALKLLNEAINVVQSVVKATYQTYVQSLKDKNMFDAAAQKNALNMAVESATKTLSVEAKNYITANFGDLTEWIILKVESTLYDLKNKPKDEITE